MEILDLLKQVDGKVRHIFKEIRNINDINITSIDNNQELEAVAHALEDRLSKIDKQYVALQPLVEFVKYYHEIVCGLEKKYEEMHKAADEFNELMKD